MTIVFYLVLLFNWLLEKNELKKEPKEKGLYYVTLLLALALGALYGLKIYLPWFVRWMNQLAGR